MIRPVVRERRQVGETRAEKNSSVPPTRPHHMLAALALVVVAPFPIGAYGMPELCQKLTTATGVIHRAASPLDDYPVFVSVKSGNPARVEALVAAALHAIWVKEDGKLRLTPVKPTSKDEGFEAWEKNAKAAMSGNPGWSDLPLRDIFLAPVGTTFRFIDPPRRNFAPLPKAAATKIKADANGDRILMFRKMSPGMLAFGGDVMMRGLPDSVVAALGEKANAIALTPEQMRNASSLIQSREAFSKLIGNIAKRDCVASVNEMLLTPVGAATDTDIALVLLDSSVFALAMGSPSGAVKDVLNGYSMAADFTVIDGAVVGQLPMCERLHASQCRRPALQWAISICKPGQVLRLSTWADYLARQRPAASEAWSDMYLLLFAGIQVDESHIADYPYNLRVGM